MGLIQHPRKTGLFLCYFVLLLSCFNAWARSLRPHLVIPLPRSLLTVLESVLSPEEPLFIQSCLKLGKCPDTLTVLWHQLPTQSLRNAQRWILKTGSADCRRTATGPLLCYGTLQFSGG